MDPNKAYLPFDPWHDECLAAAAQQRVRRIEIAVRRALNVLNTPERTIIEGYYFDGWSFPCLASRNGITLARVRTIHSRALDKLRHELTPLVTEMFGLERPHANDCPICSASWREIAEALLDEKTEDMTWGEVAIRIHRAVDWKPSSPQVLMTHQRKHRRLVHTPKGVTR